MGLGRYQRLPHGQAYAEGSALPVADLSDLAVDLARLCVGQGVLSILDPFFYRDGVIRDAAAPGGPAWTLAGDEPNAPAVTAINGQPALQYVRGLSRHWRSPFVRSEGSHTVVTVHAMAPGEAAQEPALLWGTGADETSVMHARHSASSLRFFADNTDGHGQVHVNTGAGSYVTAFCYDAAGGTAAAIRMDGQVVTAPAPSFGPYPPEGAPWEVGGWREAGYGFGGKIGRVMIFDRALHLDLGFATDLMALLQAGYGL